MSQSFVTAAEERMRDACSILALVCNQCAAVVATADELLCERVPCLDGAVWSYELDLLDTVAHCYSATNPQDARFDVARFGATACTRMRYLGEPQLEHSWFPPLGWMNASCQTCFQQLGWVFADEGRNVQFAGVIVTSLVERRVGRWATHPPLPERARPAVPPPTPQSPQELALM